MSKGFLCRLLGGLGGNAGAGDHQVRFAEPATVMEWFQAGTVTIVDVREAHEHAAGHIPGAVLVPLSAFDPLRVPVNGDKALVFHCQAGRRCGPAAEKMRAAGHQGVIHRLNGGFAAWKAAGGAVEV